MSSGSALEWLVSWTWQASLLTLVVTCGLRCAARLNASTRFTIWSATLLVALALAPLAVARLAPAPGTHAPPTLAPGDVSSRHGVGTGASSRTIQSLPSTAFPLVVPSPPHWVGVGAAMTWAIWAAFSLTRLARDLLLLARAKRRCRPIDPEVERYLTGWQSACGRGRRVRLCTSDEVATASMLGLGDPIVALRPILVDALSLRDLDRVVLHEYAHARRRDDWTGVTHAVVDALVGWHPVVWWIGRHLRLEREVACDEWVVERAGNPHAYASCLSRIAHLSVSLSKRRQNPLLAAGVTTPHAPLLTRVDRLLDPSRHRAVRARAGTVMAGVSAGAAFLVAATQIPPLVVVGPALAVAQPTTNPSDEVAAAGRRPAEQARPAFFSQNETFATETPEIRNILPPRHRPEHRRLVDSISALEHVVRASSTGILSPRSRIASDPIELGRIRPSQLAGRRGVADSARSAIRTRTASTLLTFPLPATRAGFDKIGAPLPLRSRPLRSVDIVETATFRRRGWISAAGRAIGSGASHAGLATATAFEHVGASIAQVFRPGS